MLANVFKVSSDAEMKHDGFQSTLEACEVKDLVHIIYDILILELGVFFFSKNNRQEANFDKSFSFVVAIVSGMVGSCIYTALQPFLLFCRIVLFVFSSFCIVGKWSDLKLQELL